MDQENNFKVGETTLIPACKCGHSCFSHGSHVINLTTIRFDGPCRECECKVFYCEVEAPRNNTVVYGFKE